MNKSKCMGYKAKIGDCRRASVYYHSQEYSDYSFNMLSSEDPELDQLPVPLIKHLSDRIRKRMKLSMFEKRAQ